MPNNTHHTDDSKGQRASESHVHSISCPQTVKRRVIQNTYCIKQTATQSMTHHSVDTLNGLNKLR